MYRLDVMQEGSRDFGDENQAPAALTAGSDGDAGSTFLAQVRCEAT